MSAFEFLPLGSIVSLKSIPDRMMITGRGLNAEYEGEPLFWDYCGVIYPDGLTGAEAVYFNHSNIEKVIFEGYDDDANRIICGVLEKYLDENPDIKRLNDRQKKIWS